MILTLSIDTERVAEFGDREETLTEFVESARHAANTGGRILWTKNGANVGRILRTGKEL